MPKLTGDLLALFAAVIALLGCSTALAAMHVFSESVTVGIFTTSIGTLAGFVKSSSSTPPT